MRYRHPIINVRCLETENGGAESRREDMAMRLGDMLKAWGATAVVALALALAAGPLTRPAVAQEQTIVDHLTAPAGIGEYEWTLGVARILENNSAWLRTKPQPTQGYIYNLRYALANPDKWKTLIFHTDPISPWLASENRPPFQEGLGDLKIQALMNSTWPIWILATDDPDVKTLSDLEGKTVALGPKAGTATVMAEETLKGAGMFDKVDLQYLSFADIFAGLMDGTVDVGLVLSWYNAAANKVSIVPGIVNMESANRGFHFVPWGEDVLRKTHDERGVPYHILTVPDGTIPMQQGDMALYANPDFVGVSSEFPEEAAYEFVKQTLAHLDQINSAGGLGILFTPDFLPYGLEDKLHPGAARAYREAGLIK